MRAAYTLLLHLLVPVFLLRLLLRSRRAPAYARRWGERFGGGDTPRLRRARWIHAVSVGEVNAALPVVRALLRAEPTAPVLVTTTTPTGSERVRQALGTTVAHGYLPYDLPLAVARFLARTDPAVAIVMETELWPNLFTACRRRGIPLLVVNARLSERSFRGYRRVRRLVAETLACVTRVAAQADADAERLVALGAPRERTTVTGNLKFDLELPIGVADEGRAQREGWGLERFVWIAASTHAADETPVLDSFAALLASDPAALLILVPRHPERFASATAACRARGLRTATRRADGSARRDSQCLVVDTMGELLRFYAAADLAFVGGSFGARGGQNPLEPAALAVPVLLGPHTFNFAEVTERLVSAGAARQVPDGATLGAVVRELHDAAERRRRMGEAGAAVVARHRGALARTLDVIAATSPLSPASPGSGAG